MNPVNTKFLLADDDADDTHLFCEALARIDPAMQCYTVENGRMVFELLLENKPDVIFLDINMPVMNGWKCLERLKDDPGNRDIPVIMYSTSSAKSDVEKAYTLGAQLFLTKPDDFRELCQILEIVAISAKDSLINQLSKFKSVKLS